MAQAWSCVAASDVTPDSGACVEEFVTTGRGVVLLVKVLSPMASCLERLSPQQLTDLSDRRAQV
jgi:hypothetical protein